MAVECPVCHRPISFWRVIRTTAWGSWRCPDCDSKLGVDRKRRFLALIPWTIVVLSVMVFTPLMQYSMFLTVGLLVGFFFAIFYAFEQATVLEQAGFRCTKCGYDLQGQVDPLCPECGYELSADEQSLLARIRSGDSISVGQMRQHIKGRWGMGGIIIVIAAAILLVGTLGGLLVTISNKRARSVSPETKLLLNSVLNYVTNNNGDEPRHALEHARDDILTSSVFVLPNSQTNLQLVMMGGVALDGFDTLPDAEQDKVVETAITQLPAEVIAHRVGDFVFTYHGMDLPASASANTLWLVIGMPDPNQNGPPLPQDQIPVGLADGSVVLITGSNFATALSTQNKLRGQFGLPPLPDPRHVTHDQPAVSGGEEALVNDEPED